MKSTAKIGLLTISAVTLVVFVYWYIQFAQGAVLFYETFDDNGFSSNWQQDAQNDWTEDTSESNCGAGTYSAHMTNGADAWLETVNTYDVSGYTSANVSADLMISAGLDGPDYLCLDYSCDGGSNWNLDTGSDNGVGGLCLDGNEDPEGSWEKIYFDVETECGSLPSNLQIRFRGAMGGGEHGYADCANISASGDALPPTITIDSPENQSYSTDTININVTLNEDGDWCGYNFNGGTNYTMNNNSMTNWFIENQTALSEGVTTQLEIYCNDTTGNMALNDTIWFTYQSTAWADNYFTRRKPIEFQNTSVLLEHQLPINLSWDSDMQDFTYVCFYSNDTGTKLNYWMEDSVASDWAYYWVLTSDDVVWMYYNNSTTSSCSPSGGDTFLVFDDFDDESINTTIWGGHTGDFLESGGLLTTDQAGKIIDTNASGFYTASSGIVEARAHVDSGARADIRILRNQTTGVVTNNYRYPNSDVRLIDYTTALNESAYTHDDYYKRVTVSADGTNVKATIANYTDGTNSLELTESQTDSLYGGVGLGTGGMDSGNATWDWIFARKFITSDPSYDVGEEEIGGGGDTPPTVTLVSPDDESTDSDGTITFNCSAEDDSGLEQISLWHNGTGTWHENATNTSVSGEEDFAEFTVSFGLLSATIEWNCNATDDAWQNNTAASNRTVNIDTGQPYLIHYTHSNITYAPLSRDGIYSILYGDVANSGERMYLWGPATETRQPSAEREIYITYENGTSVKVWDNGTSSSFAAPQHFTLVDWDNDDSNEILYGEADTSHGWLVMLELDKDLNVLTEDRFDVRTDGGSNTPKTYCIDDWDNDGVKEALSGFCGSGEFILIDGNKGSLSGTTIANYDATAEWINCYDANGDGKLEAFVTHGWSNSDVTTTIKVHYLYINDSLGLETDTTVITNTSYSMALLSEGVHDIDDDGYNEMAIAWLNDNTNVVDLYTYNISNDGSMTVDFFIETISDVDHEGWSLIIEDHDLDGDYEIIGGFKNSDQSTKSVYLWDCPSGSCTKTTLFSGTEHTNDTAQQGFYFWRNSGDSSGNLPIVGITTLSISEKLIWNINWTLPKFSKIWEYPTNDIYLSSWCFDSGTNSTPLRLYYEIYNNSVKQDSLTGSVVTDNGTEVNITILAGNLSDNDVWHAQIWCDDGYENSTMHNSTNITIKADTSFTITWTDGTDTLSTDSGNTSDSSGWFNDTEDIGNSKNVTPTLEGSNPQTSSLGFLNFTNTGDVALKWEMTLASTLPSSIVLFGSLDNDPSTNTFDINSTAWAVVNSSIGVNDFDECWIWANFTSNDAGVDIVNLQMRSLQA